MEEPAGDYVFDPSAYAHEPAPLAPSPAPRPAALSAALARPTLAPSRAPAAPSQPPRRRSETLPDRQRPLYVAFAAFIETLEQAQVEELAEAFMVAHGDWADGHRCPGATAATTSNGYDRAWLQLAERLDGRKRGWWAEVRDGQGVAIGPMIHRIYEFKQAAGSAAPTWYGRAAIAAAGAWFGALLAQAELEEGDPGVAAVGWPITTVFGSLAPWA